MEPQRAIKDEKIQTLREAFRDRDPFSTGVCVVPDHQLLLYYTQADQNHDGSQARRIDFSKCTNEDLAELYRACTPASFGMNQETVIDATYRKAGKMDLDTFSTLFDPRSLGIHEEILTGFLCRDNVEMELYKLNVYGEGDFFKSHKDTPRGRRMIGSLVVVLPTQHSGGQLVLRQLGKEWTIDFSERFAAATSPSICFAAFFGDVDHEVLPVSSGYRVTLTYNLYSIRSNATASYIPTRFHEKLKGALIDILNDETKLPNGGYLGFGLVHKYVYDDKKSLYTLDDQLKGSDKALAQICEELSLPFSIQLLYRDIEIWFERTRRECPFLATERLEFSMGGDEGDDTFKDELGRLSIDEIEGINLVGEYQVDPAHLVGDLDYLKPFYKVPVTQVLEINEMSSSSVQAVTPITIYGNEVFLDNVYGAACMLVEVEPVESRVKLVL